MAPARDRAVVRRVRGPSPQVRSMYVNSSRVGDHYRPRSRPPGYDAVIGRPIGRGRGAAAIFATMLFCAVALGAGIALAAPSTSPTSIACTTQAVEAALAAGGSYTIDC